MSDRSGVRHSNPVTQAGFTMIPNTIMFRRDLSSNAKLVYGYLKHLAWRGGDDEAAPGRHEIGRDLNLSPNTVKEAIRSLEAIGLVEQQRRGLGLSNLYLIHDPESASSEVDEAEIQEVQIPTRAVAVGVKTELIRPGAPDVAPEPPGIKKVDGRNLPLDALLEVCGIDPASGRSVAQAAFALNGRKNASGKLSQQGITHLFWVEVERWDTERARLDSTDQLPSVRKRFHVEPEKYAEALARQIRIKAARYRARLDGAILTPTALAKWWLDLERQTSGGLTAEEIEHAVF